MACKKNFLINLTMDWDHLEKEGITPPWFSIGKLNLESLAKFLKEYIYTGDKIDILAADDYLDFISIQSAITTGKAEDLITHMSSLMTTAKKTTGQSLLPVTEGWRRELSLISNDEYDKSPPPFALFFQVRGSSEETVGLWLGHLSSHMGVNPAIAAFTGKKQGERQLFSALEIKLEEVFGVRFIKESGLCVI